MGGGAEEIIFLGLCGEGFCGDVCRNAQVEKTVRMFVCTAVVDRLPCHFPWSGAETGASVSTSAVVVMKVEAAFRVYGPGYNAKMEIGTPLSSINSSQLTERKETS